MRISVLTASDVYRTEILVSPLYPTEYIYCRLRQCDKPRPPLETTLNKSFLLNFVPLNWLL
jgi:hypothetical protein